MLLQRRGPIPQQTDTLGYPFYTVCSVIRVVEKSGMASGVEIIWSETY